MGAAVMLLQGPQRADALMGLGMELALHPLISQLPGHFPT